MISRDNLKQRLRSIWDAESPDQLHRAICYVRFRRVVGVIETTAIARVLYYPGFGHPAADVKTYADSSVGLFTLLLKNDTVVHYEPINPALFRSWLSGHGIQNVKTNQWQPKSPIIHERNESPDKHKSGSGG